MFFLSMVSVARVCLQLDCLVSYWNWGLMSRASTQEKQWLFPK